MAKGNATLVDKVEHGDSVGTRIAEDGHDVLQLLGRHPGFPIAKDQRSALMLVLSLDMALCQ